MTKRKAATMQTAIAVQTKERQIAEQQRAEALRGKCIVVNKDQAALTITPHAQLYPERYGHPRLWDRVKFPERWIAFEAWERTTQLYRLTNEKR